MRAADSGAAIQVSLQNPLRTGARVGPVAHVLPLLAALEQGEPAGLVATSRDTLIVFESELGLVRRVEDVVLEPGLATGGPR
jgi:hypothetical protein